MIRSFWHSIPIILLLLIALPAVAQESAFARAEQAIANGNLSAAQAEFQRAATLHTQQAEWALAASAYARLLELGPVGSQVHQAYGDVLRETGDLAGAVVQYEFALAPPTQTLAEQASLALQAGDRTAATELYLRGIAEDPDWQEGLRALAKMSTEDNLWANAVKYYGLLSKLTPLNAEECQAYGDALRETGDLPGALVQYELALTAPKPSTFLATPVPAKYQQNSLDALAHRPSVAERSTNVTPPFRIEEPPTELTRDELAYQPTIILPVNPTTEPAAAGTINAESTTTINHAEGAVTGFSSSAVARSAPGDNPAPAVTGNPSTQRTSSFDSPLVSYQASLSGQAANIQLPYEANGQREAAAPVQTAAPDPTSQEGWISLAQAQGTADKWNEAAASYEQAIGFGPVGLDVHLDYADALRRAGELTRSEEEYNRLLHVQADSVDAKIGLAKVLAEQGQLIDSMYLLDQIYLDQESFTRARLARAYAYFVNGYVQETWRDLGDVLASDPRTMAAYDTLREANFSESAWHEFRSAVAAVPGFEDTLEMIEVIVEAEKLRAYELPTDSYGRAEALFQRGDYSQARQEYESLVMKDPLNTRGWERLARMYTWEDDWTSAIEAYESYLRMVPHDLMAQLRYAQVLMWSGDAELAVEELESILTNPDTPLETYEQAQVVYALALYHAGRSKEAILRFQEALIFQPRNINALVSYGDVLASEGMFADAIIQYQAALNEDSGNEDALLGIARTYAWSGDQKMAQQYYGQMSMDGGNYFEATVGESYSNLWEGDMGRARELADEAARLDPNNPEVPLLYARLNDSGQNILSSTVRQSHDSDGNDISSVDVQLTVPLGHRGMMFTARNEDMKLDNTDESAEAIATNTTVALSTPLGRDTTWRIQSGYIDVDYGTPFGFDEWTWGTSFAFQMDESWSVGLSYRDWMYLDTTELIRNAIHNKEYGISSNWKTAEDTYVIAQFSHAKLSDGNHRDSWGLTWRQAQRYQGRGLLTYGAAYRGICYEDDLDNGYWDPSKYHYGELFFDWFDQSEHALLFDVGAGIGWDNASGRASAIGLRYKLGLRTYQLNNRLLLKAGYEASNASNAATDRADYDNGAWYFTGEYAF